MIKIKDFSFSFNNSKKRILKNITLHIPKKQFALITGPSGCGKSTLAFAIAGFSSTLGKTSGTLTVDGKDVLSRDVFKNAPTIGIVQQDPEAQLVALTVEEEVAFGPENLMLDRGEVTSRITEGLKLAKATHLKNRLTCELSGGEKQKVALASMLAMKPKVLIFDEPTSNLDPVATREIFNSIISLGEAGMTILVIEHKIDALLSYANHLIIMENGTIKKSGKPQKVLEDRSLKKMGIRIPHKKTHTAKSHLSNYGQKIIDVSNLSLNYGEKNVVKNVNFSAYEGEMICFMGENGSGKTTFLSSLLGLTKPKEGFIKIVGKDLTKEKTSNIAKHIGFVFQNPNHQIFEDSVKKEILFAPHNFGMETIDLPLITKKFNLEKEKNDQPHKLSFGQKRRLNIASIYSYSPKIIILDEPFIGQDFINATKIMNILENLKKKDNLIMFVSHDPRLVSKYCTRIVFFENGTILFDSNPDDVYGKLKDMGKTEFLPCHMRDKID
ncbi:MAG: ABC transporter ATP-binding protein [Candidatus Methanofastidiosia archaeon]